MFLKCFSNVFQMLPKRSPHAPGAKPREAYDFQMFPKCFELNGMSQHMLFKCFAIVATTIKQLGRNVIRITTNV